MRDDVRLQLKVLVRLLDEGLPLPARQHPGDAGFDLHSAVDVHIAPGARVVVGTGIAIAIPEGYVGLGAPRSGLAAREGLTHVNAPGIVDSGFRGEVKMVLHNTDRETAIAIRRGERIGQLVIVPLPNVELVAVDELPPTRRGEGGFGSTGR